MADPYSLLHANDLSAASSLEFVSKRAAGTDNGLNFDANRRYGAADAIVISGVEWRVTAYWTGGPSNPLEIAVSKNRGAWRVYQTTLTPTATDAHYAVTVGIDESGYVHVFYDMWSTALKYRRSTNPIDTFDGTLTATQTLSGTAETSIEYCTPVRGRNGEGFYVFLRKGVAGNGDLMGYSWNGSAWSALADSSTDGLIVEGTEGANWSIYWSDVQFTSDWDGAGVGDMYLAYDWWDNTNNSRVSILRWNPVDGFRTMAGGSQTVPITQANCDIVNDIAAGTGLRSSPSLAITPSDRPMVCYSHTVSSNQTFSVSSWNGSSWDTNVALTGSGASAYFGYPDVVVRSDGTAVVVYTDIADNLIKKIESDGTDYTTWGSGGTVNAGVVDQTDFGNLHVRYYWDEFEEYVMPVPFTATAPWMLDSLRVYLPLDESSGNRRDAADFLLFTDTNTVASATGKVSTAGDFEVTNTEYLTRAAETANRITGNISVWAWVQIESTGAFRTIIARANTTGSQSCYKLDYDNTNSRFRFQVSSDGSTLVNVLANTFGAPSTGTWYLVCGTYDGTNITISVNGGTRDTTSHTAGIFNSATAALNIGATSVPSLYWDGLIDEAGVAARAMTNAQEAWLYNSASGRSFRDLPLIAPTIWSHGATATVNCTAGDTPSVVVAAWGDLPMSEALTGTDAASYDVVDNDDGTWTVTRDSAISAGDEEVTLTLTNDAGTDAVDLTFSAAGAGGGLLLSNAAYFARQM